MMISFLGCDHGLHPTRSKQSRIEEMLRKELPAYGYADAIEFIEVRPFERYGGFQSGYQYHFKTIRDEKRVDGYAEVYWESR